MPQIVKHLFSEAWNYDFQLAAVAFRASQDLQMQGVYIISGPHVDDATRDNYFKLDISVEY